MNISFWNTHRNKEINEFLVSIINEKNIDIMIMAEYEDNINYLINELYIKGMYYTAANPIAYKKIKILYRRGIIIEINNDCSNYVSILVSNYNFEFELFATHFPSKLHTSEDNRKLIAGILKNDIEQYDKVLVVGDFNCNPFEKTMSALSGLLALPTKEYKKRKVNGIEKKILYNPMWKFFGDFETNPGTYFYNSSNDLNYYWNLFDQVLVSQELADLFNNEKLEIIKEINKKCLIKENKINSEISDHLPIVFSLEEEKNGRGMEK